MRRTEDGARAPHQRRSRFVALVASWVLVAVALAPMPARGDDPLAPANPPLVAPPPPITAEQLDAFVDLTREPKPWVWYRLLSEPGLVPYAVAAADARLERRTAGRRLSTIGFVVLGVGSILGASLWATGLQENIDCGDHSGCGASPVASYGIPLIVASIAVGGALGIGGAASESGSSPAEREALARYRTSPALPTTPDASPAAVSDARAPRLVAPKLYLPLSSLGF